MRIPPSRAELLNERQVANAHPGRRVRPGDEVIANHRRSRPSCEVNQGILAGSNVLRIRRDVPHGRTQCLGDLASIGQQPRLSISYRHAEDHQTGRSREETGAELWSTRSIMVKVAEHNPGRVTSRLVVGRKPFIQAALSTGDVHARSIHPRSTENPSDDWLVGWPLNHRIDPQ